MKRVALLVSMLGLVASAASMASTVRLKDIARVEGARDNALTGYGIVIGLSGSGDSRKNAVTSQSVANALSHYGVHVNAKDLSTRNAAAVMVTATLPAFAESGQKIDVEVSSIGDAHSLSGGMLLLTPLRGPDGKLYALAQGPVSVGGYLVRSYGSREQENHPTVGRVPDGATLERAAPQGTPEGGNTLDVVLYQPDYVTAQRVVDSINAHIHGVHAHAIHAGKIAVHTDDGSGSMVRLIAQLDQVPVEPDAVARVVVNERTGTVVAGGDVSIGAVTISQGDLRIQVRTRYQVSQPEGAYIRPTGNIGTAVVPDTHISVHQPEARAVTVPDGATVTDLVSALRAVHMSTRDVITVLQSIKAAGALHGELVIQ